MTSIEDKAKYEKANGQKLPDKILADCELCEGERTFEYTAIQGGYVMMPDIPLYTCTGCTNPARKFTRAYQTLMKDFNGGAVE